MADTFLIANMTVGLERDREPWLLPDQAFPTLEDAYLFRGRIERRKGYVTLGRLVTEVGGMDTINNLPVMGLRTRELTTINQEQLIAFDTDKANRYSNFLSKFVDITFHKTTSNVFSWTGSNSDFFWTTNYANAFWATNSVAGFQNIVDATNPAAGDGIRWYDGSGWINFLPQVDNVGPNFLMGALLIVSYRNRLVMLNTTEGTAFGASNNFPQRARWCQNGTPYYVAPVPTGFTGGTDANSWRDDQIGKGGFIDAPTSEQIVGAAFIHDVLIVYFERSTWKLVYTGDPYLPFIWERINVDLGAESTFSTVAFDSGLVGVGNYGIIESNANQVRRIDQKIPDEVFEIHNGNDGVKRVYGIRDFSKQLIYWTFPDADPNPTFPTKVLVYDYLEGTYAIFNESLTCFGYFQPADDQTWADLPEPWNETPYPWNAAQFQSDFPQIVAGNQQGFVFNRYNAGPIINEPSLFITNITQAVGAVVSSANHNLLEGTIISISDVVGMTQVNGNIYRVSTPTANTFILQTLDANGNFIDVDSTGFTAYSSDGLITVRNNIHILTKKFNPYINTGYQLRLNHIDYFVEFSEGLEFTSEVFLDENNNESVEAVIVLPNTNINTKVWYPAYYSSIGQFAQIELTFSDEQMFDPAKSSGNVTIHALMLYTTLAGRLAYGEII